MPPFKHLFFESVLDALPENISVIQPDGTIIYVNQTWHFFAESNDATASCTEGVGQNYLIACDRAQHSGDALGGAASAGIRSVISGDKASFEMEYPCHSLNERRWFMMNVTPIVGPSGLLCITHHNITLRKLAEAEARRMAEEDSLTGLPNRRHIDGFLLREVRRCARLSRPITFMLADLDHFKLVNDKLGHDGGDLCLQTVAQTLGTFARRPGDLIGRYGGEEFAMIFAGTPPTAAATLADNILGAIRALKLPNGGPPERPYVALSLGVATGVPSPGADPAVLVKAADRLLYQAKAAGRDQAAWCASSTPWSDMTSWEALPPPALSDDHKSSTA